MGDVYRPEDVTSVRDVQVRDLTPSSLSPSSLKVSLITILREIGVMKKDIAQIKQTMQSHGIAIE